MYMYEEGEATFSKSSNIHVLYITGSVFSSSIQNCFQIENICTRSAFFPISKCACMGYLSAEYCRLILFSEKLASTAIKNHHTYSIVYQSNSYFNLYQELFSNWQNSYNKYLFWFFESMCWMLLDAPICLIYLKCEL